MACISAGGTVSIVVNGTLYPVRGNVTITPTDGERSEGANLDGTPYTTFKPMPPKIEATLSDYEGLSIIDLQNVQCQDIVVELEEVGRTFIMTNGSLVGRPSLNPETGEISNVGFVGSRIKELIG